MQDKTTLVTHIKDKNTINGESNGLSSITTNNGRDRTSSSRPSSRGAFADAFDSMTNIDSSEPIRYNTIDNNTEGNDSQATLNQAIYYECPNNMEEDQNDSIDKEKLNSENKSEYSNSEDVGKLEKELSQLETKLLREESILKRTIESKIMVRSLDNKEHHLELPNVSPRLFFFLCGLFLKSSDSLLAIEESLINLEREIYEIDQEAVRAK